MPDRTLGQVIWLLLNCCTPVTRRRAATCSLMVMQEICDNEEIGFEGGQYASSEEELYEKAIALLEMCKIETRRSGQKITEPTAETRQWPYNPQIGRKRRVGTVVSLNALTKEHPEHREQADGDGYGGDRGPQDVSFPA